LLGGGGDQHDAGLGAGHAQFLPALTHRGRAAGELQAEDQRVAVGLARRRKRHLDLLDVDVELFGEQHRHRGVGPLPHLGRAEIRVMVLSSAMCTKALGV